MDIEQNGSNATDSLSANETLVAELAAIAENREDFGSAHARALLASALGYEYPIIIEELEQGLQLRPENATAVEVVKTGNEGTVNIYPNPSAGLINIEYAFEDGKTGIFKVYNSLGQVLQQQSFPGSSGKVQVEIPGSSGSLYYFILEIDGVPMKREKMVIIK